MPTFASYEGSESTIHMHMTIYSCW